MANAPAYPPLGFPPVRIPRMMPTIPIRRLAPDDAPAYRALMLEAYASHPDAFLSEAAERAALPLAWWAERIDPGARAASVVFGATHDGALRGVVGATLSDRAKTRHKASVFGLFVAASLRGTGTARTLMHAVLGELERRASVRVVQLTVTEGNEAALGLYRSLGFREFGREPMAMRLGDAWLAKVHLWLDLDGPFPGRDAS